MNDTLLIENYLHRKLDPAAKLLVEARMLIDSDFYDKVQCQQLTYGIVTSFGRKQLKAELEEVHTSLFSAREFRSFRKKIFKIFRSE